VVHEPKIICTCNDRSKLARLGEDVTEVLEKIPARLKVIRHVRPRYACRTCEAVFQAPAPELPIERGRPGPGLIANVAVSKFCDGLPLYRQSVILGREGIEIDRATLADWLGHAAWWLAPLAVLIGHQVMRSPVIHTTTPQSRCWHRATVKPAPPASGSMLSTRALGRVSSHRLRSTATALIAMASVRVSISPTSAGSCTPMLMLATAHCIGPAATSRRG
jgi:transposase